MSVPQQKVFFIPPVKMSLMMKYRDLRTDMLVLDRCRQVVKQINDLTSDVHDIPKVWFYMR